jgi:hypothetical protein
LVTGRDRYPATNKDESLRFERSKRYYKTLAEEVGLAHFFSWDK